MFFLLFSSLCRLCSFKIRHCPSFFLSVNLYAFSFVFTFFLVSPLGIFHNFFNLQLFQFPFYLVILIVGVITIIFISFHHGPLIFIRCSKYTYESFCSSRSSFVCISVFFSFEDRSYCFFSFVHKFMIFTTVSPLRSHWRELKFGC